MALIQCDFFSEVLSLSVSMNVILPQRAEGQIGMEGSALLRDRYPVLYLLHGMSDDHSTWLRRTSIERYVAPLGYAVVMPAVHRSYYTNMASGLNFWSFIRDEVPARAEEFFPVSSDPSERYVAGLSMGGYGAFKLALSCPERFAAAASLSGALDAVGLFQAYGEERRQEAVAIFGPNGSPRPEDDLFHLARKASSPGQKRPRLYQCCGSEDFLIEHNRRFRDHLRSLNVPLTYEEEPGTHEWGYWDQKIQRVLDFFQEA